MKRQMLNRDKQHWTEDSCHPKRRELVQTLVRALHQARSGLYTCDRNKKGLERPPGRSFPIKTDPVGLNKKCKCGLDPLAARQIIMKSFGRALLPGSQEVMSAMEHLRT